MVAIASYFVRAIVIGAMQIAYNQQHPVRRPPPKPAPPKAIPVPSAPRVTKAPVIPKPVKPKAIPPSPLAKVPGLWRGRAAFEGRGVCELKFELREKQESPGHFSGFSSMTCNGAGPLTGRKVNTRTLMLNTMDPEAAIFSGSAENGSIELKADKTIGTDSNGCAPTAFTLTPFGTGQLAAEWQEGNCSGGHMVLRRAGR